MTKLFLFFLFFFFVLIGESLFCFISKGLQTNRESIKKSIQTEETNKSIIRKAYSFINDFTFLLFKIVGYLPSHHVRIFMYRYIFHMNIGDRTVIYYGLEARNPWNITIGEDCSIGDRAIIDARYPIIIGNHVNISTGCWIWTVQHDVNSKSFSTHSKELPIKIGTYSWISSRTTILPGCDIAEGVVVAAGAVVTKPCDKQYAIYGGIPSKIIGNRSRELNYELTKSYRHFL